MYHYQLMYHSADSRLGDGHQGGVSLPLNVSQCKLEVRCGCHYHSVYHSTGWKSGEGCQGGDVTTTQYITV